MVAKCLVNQIFNNTNMNVSRDLLPCLQYLLMGREYCSELALKLPLWKLLRREPVSVAEKFALMVECVGLEPTTDPL